MRTAQWIATMMGALVIAVSTAQLSAQTTPKGGPSDGIKVHGHWTLEITNPDGTPAGRYEFENALANHLGAGKALAELLAGVAAGGHFSIGLYTTDLNACNPNNAPCSITELADSTRLGNSRDLVKSVPTTGPNAGKLVLAGSIRIPTNTTIASVQTNLATCAGSVAPSSCVSNFAVGFTQKDLSPALTIQPNQLVDVTVVISFS
jgi:hypothetical protein